MAESAPATLALASDPDTKEVVVHPLVLLSVVDHYNRVAKDSRRRVVGVLLGESFKGRVDVTNSFAGGRVVVGVWGWQPALRVCRQATAHAPTQPSAHRLHALLC